MGISLIYFTDNQDRNTGYFEYIVYIIFNIINIYLMISYFGKSVSVNQRIEKYMHNFDHDKLSDREKEIINCIKKGRSNKDIAKELQISENTVKTHIYNIFSKLKVKNRIELINKFQ